MEPLPPGSGFEFVNETFGGSIPKEYIGPAEAGMKEALEGGILAGFPMSDLRVTLYDGSYHDVDSSEIAFKIAGSIAVKEAARRAKPVLLEPIMAGEGVGPREGIGDGHGGPDLRGGRVRGRGAGGPSQHIKDRFRPAGRVGFGPGFRSPNQ